MASGNFGGFHGDPTFLDRYVFGPVVLGVAIGVPTGILGFVIGMLARRSACRPALR